MIFNYVLDPQQVNTENAKVNYREAVRAIVIQNNKILMVHSKKGDYKFPGGGVNKEEIHEEALKREVREETGYIIDNVKNKIGIVTERKLDDYDKDSVFEMISYYYLCEVSEKQTFQELDDYEIDLGFHPVWISIDEAISNNEGIIENRDNDINLWVYREISVLHKLKDIIA